MWEEDSMTRPAPTTDGCEQRRISLDKMCEEFKKGLTRCISAEPMIMNFVSLCVAWKLFWIKTHWKQKPSRNRVDCMFEFYETLISSPYSYHWLDRGMICARWDLYLKFIWICVLRTFLFTTPSLMFILKFWKLLLMFYENKTCFPVWKRIWLKSSVFPKQL